jgi:hypothetical protein
MIMLQYNNRSDISIMLLSTRKEIHIPWATFVDSTISTSCLSLIDIIPYPHDAASNSVPTSPVQKMKHNHMSSKKHEFGSQHRGRHQQQWNHHGNSLQVPQYYARKHMAFDKALNNAHPCSKRLEICFTFVV